MEVVDAVESRFSCRAYLDKPIDPGVIRDMLDRAARSASSGNFQSWQVHALTGDALARFTSHMADVVADKNPYDFKTEFPAYPIEMREPYKSRRERMGAQLYGALGINRADMEARLGFYRQNFQFFGAPVGLLFSIDRSLGAAQWVDVGSYIQTLMFLARANGLHSCAQVAWSQVHKEVSAYLDLPPDRILFCGMAIGHGDPDHPVNRFRTERVEAAEFCRFYGFD